MLEAWRRHRARARSLDGLRSLEVDDEARGFGTGARVRVADGNGRILYDGPGPIPGEYWATGDSEVDSGLGYTFTVIYPSDVVDAPPPLSHLRLVD